MRHDFKWSFGAGLLVIYVLGSPAESQQPVLRESSSVSSASAKEAASMMTRVYECRINGQRVFSDQVCATDARARDIAMSTRSVDKNAISSQRSSAVSASAARKKNRDEDESRDVVRTRCKALLQDKDQINARMRTGYKNDEGERLRVRLRKIDSEYYELRCSALR